MEEGLPVISVDTKKKENIGNFKNNGSEYAPKGNPTAVLDHDFPILGLGKASPYGIYDARENEGYVNAGIRVSKKELEELNISRHEFHGEWNYWVSPSETFA